jgi:hypothetical protein
MIVVDKAGKKAVRELCDLALKVGGMQNFDHVRNVLDSVEFIEDKKNGKRNPSDVSRGEQPVCEDKES